MVGVCWWVLLVVQACSAVAICPSRCSCQDAQASCLGAQLEVVPIQFNPEVHSIDLRNNRITNVHYTLSFYTKLVSFDISRNKITSFGSKNFEAQANLIYLNASHNHISTLGKDTFKGLTQVKIIDLSYNRIEMIDGEALKDSSKLEHLDLSHNRITSFSDTTFLKSAADLRVLLLDSNQILDVPNEVLKHLPGPCTLETLALSDNLIESLEVSSFVGPCSSSLRSLSLASNVIREIDKAAFNPLHNLEKLDLSFNNLTSVPTHQLSKLGQLSELNLSGNMFQDIKPVAFQSLFQLRILKLNSLPFLTRLDGRAFVDNIRLETILIEENPSLVKIPPRIFHGNPHLVHISLKGDSIKTFDASFFPLDKLKTLDVTSNPLNCNCSLLWLWTLAQLETKSGNNESERLILVTGGLTCGEPSQLKGKSLTDVPESAVRCETTWLTVAVVTALVLALFGATCVVLLMFNDRKLCWCRRDKQPSPQDPHRLPPGLHAVSSPTPILMLMPDKHFTDDFVKPWPPVRNDYSPDLTSAHRKQPHIVYV